MAGMLGILDSMTFRKNHLPLKGLPKYDEFMAILTDPRLYNSLQILWSRYCTLTVNKQPLPLNDLIIIVEKKELSLLDNGMLAGEIHIDLMMEHGVHFELYYAPDAKGDPTDQLAFQLNGQRFTNFEKVLNELVSDEFAQSQFPEGYAQHLEKVSYRPRPKRTRPWWQFWR